MSDKSEVKKVTESVEDKPSVEKKDLPPDTESTKKVEEQKIQESNKKETTPRFS